MEYLQQYQQLYNESPHRSLGQLSPFEVYFDRKPNRYRNKLLSLIANPQPPKMAIVCFMQCMTSYFARASQSAKKLRSDPVKYLRSNPATPDGTHLSEFTNLGAWDIYLRRMAMEGEWGDWIA